MTLGADIAANLPQLRVEAESMMQTVCRVGVGTYGTDPVTLNPTYTFDQIIYVGKCRIRFTSSATNTVDVGGQDVAVQSLTLSLPIAGTTTVRTGHLVEVTANPTDPGLVGTVFRISGMHRQTYATARRFPLEAVS